MQNHILKECPFTLISCQYADFGCQESVRFYYYDFRGKRFDEVILI